MTDRKMSHRALTVIVACVALFLLGSVKAYLDRGYVAVGGEYVFLTVPAMVLGVDVLRGGE